MSVQPLNAEFPVSRCGDVDVTSDSIAIMGINERVCEGADMVAIAVACAATAASVGAVMCGPVCSRDVVGSARRRLLTLLDVSDLGALPTCELVVKPSSACCDIDIRSNLSVFAFLKTWKWGRTMGSVSKSSR